MAISLKETIAIATLAATPLVANEEYSPCCLEYRVNPPYLAETCGFSGAISYLYWRPYQDQFDWVYKAIPFEGDLFNLQDSFATFRGDVESKCLKPEWDSGFRVEVGYNLPCDMWSLTADWTHLRTDTEDQISCPNTILEPGFVIGNSLSPDPIFGTDAITQNLARLDWNFSFNQLDIDLRRSFYTGCSFILTPYAGFRALWIHQKARIIVEQSINVDEGTLEFSLASLSIMKGDFKSFGVKGGLHTLYEIACGLGIYGDFSAALVYGNQSSSHILSSQQELTFGTMTQNSEGFNDASFECNTWKAVLDLKLGLEWHTRFNCDRSAFFVRVGWEHHAYFDENTQITIQQHPTALTLQGTMPQIIENCGSLYLYGLVFSIGADF